MKRAKKLNFHQLEINILKYKNGIPVINETGILNNESYHEKKGSL